MALVAGLAVIMIAIVTGAGRTAEPTSDIVPVRITTTIPSAGMTLGRADAPVTVNLYEDFQCPACATWRESVFPSLLEREIADGTVRLVFHDLAFIGDESVAAGTAAFAAAQQGRFWDFWSTLYANQGQQENAGAFTTDRLTAMARALGLDLTRFARDMDSAAADESLDEARASAAALQIDSTPSLVIDDKLFVGVTPYPEIAAAIAQAAR